ncbi:hypothetical protein FEM03_02785 [Phragmitibacter flavus]|uniref:Prenyltransferase n=1 Tax=Phragmitibacter flavus TaxID=2576071 RepID=A0A5R8KIZ3_9BACT|nr:UbiA family prenyltransferase [Phragmitibacter flavus]TLD72298.1 hypothetical protein FEM03_02785 [Phragmitibacter flavus]
MTMRVWLELARISNLPTVWTNVLAGWVLAGGKWEGEWVTLAWLLLGGSLLYTGGMFLNDAADARWDREHRAERPIAMGRVKERMVWLVAVIFLAVGLGMVVIGGGANVWVSLALVAAIVGYDLYHKPWKGSVLVMGMCRVLLYLMAGSAVAGGWEWGGNGGLIFKALALGGDVGGLSLAARGEGGKGDGGGWLMQTMGVFGLLLPLIFVLSPLVVVWWHWFVVSCFGVLFSIRLVATTSEFSEEKKFRIPWGLLIIGLPLIMMAFFIPFRTTPEQRAESLTMTLVVVVAVVLFLVIDLALHWMKTPPKSNIGRAVGLLLAAIPVVDALAVVRINPWLAVGFVASMPLLRLWQRKIAAT